MTKRREQFAVSLNTEARAALAKITEFRETQLGAPKLSKAATIALALDTFWEIVSPDSSASLYDDERLMETLQAKSFMITCQSLVSILEHCGSDELLEGGFSLTGDPTSQVITVTVGDKKVILNPPVGAEDAVPAFKHTARLH